MMRSNQKIAIIAHGLRSGGGISVGKNLIAGLFAQRADARYLVFVPAGIGYEDIALPNAASRFIAYEVRFGLVGRWLHDNTTLVSKLKSFSPDILLCLGNIGIGRPMAPQVLLVHDPHLFYPDIYYSRESALRLLYHRYKRWRFARDIQNSCVVLCQTQTAERRVREMYGYTGRIEIQPNALSKYSISGRVQHRKSGESGKNTFNLFYLTRYYPHKNIEILLELFSKYRKELTNVVLHLTISADQHPNARALLKAIIARGLGDSIITLGPIEQKDIASHFSRMDALIMPTTLESYSGSYREAMIFGCPILTSELDFAKEVCGDAAIYFDPWDVDSIYQALRQIIDQPELSNVLVERGFRLLSDHGTTWEHNVQQLLKVMDEILQIESVTLPEPLGATSPNQP